MDDDAIALTLDRPTAQALLHLLREVGEHWAADAELVPPPSEEMERLGALLRAVDVALGRNTTRFA